MIFTPFCGNFFTFVKVPILWIMSTFISGIDQKKFKLMACKKAKEVVMFNTSKFLLRLSLKLERLKSRIQP